MVPRYKLRQEERQAKKTREREKEIEVKESYLTTKLSCLMSVADVVPYAHPFLSLTSHRSLRLFSPLTFLLSPFLRFFFFVAVRSNCRVWRRCVVYTSTRYLRLLLVGPRTVSRQCHQPNSPLYPFNVRFLSFKGYPSVLHLESLPRLLCIFSILFFSLLTFLFQETVYTQIQVFRKPRIIHELNDVRPRQSKDNKFARKECEGREIVN